MMSLSFSIRDQSDMRHDKAGNIIEHKGKIVEQYIYTITIHNDSDELDCHELDRHELKSVG